MDSKALDQLAALLRRATALLEAAGQPGWLVRMAADERAHDEFVTVHNSVLEILQVGLIQTLILILIPASVHIGAPAARPSKALCADPVAMLQTSRSVRQVCPQLWLFRRVPQPFPRCAAACCDLAFSGGRHKRTTII